LLNLRRGFFAGSMTGILPLTSSTPCRRMRLRLAIRDQFARAITPPQHTRLHSKAAGERSRKPAALPLRPNAQPCRGFRWGCRTGSHGESAVRPRNHTPALRGLVSGDPPRSANVRFGSKADIGAPPTNVRFTLKSGHWNSVVMSALRQNPDIGGFIERPRRWSNVLSRRKEDVLCNALRVALGN
jgi:hypothetical protein